MLRSSSELITAFDVSFAVCRALADPIQPPAACLEWLTTSVLISTYQGHRGSAKEAYGLVADAYEKALGADADMSQWQYHDSTDKLWKRFWT